MIVSQGYPLYVTSLYVAGPHMAGVEYRDRTCQDEPGHDDVAVDRVIGWDLSDDEDGIAVPVTDSRTKGAYAASRGHEYRLHESREAAEAQANRLSADLDAFWEIHDDCTCRGAHVEFRWGPDSWSWRTARRTEPASAPN